MEEVFLMENKKLLLNPIGVKLKESAQQCRFLDSVNRTLVISCVVKS